MRIAFSKKCKKYYVPISEHLFEYIGTQFPPPSDKLYGKIILFVSNGYIRHDTTIYALVIDRHFIFYSKKYYVELFFIQ
jgi:hypothetical protein